MGINTFFQIIHAFISQCILLPYIYICVFKYSIDETKKKKYLNVEFTAFTYKRYSLCRVARKFVIHL